MKKILTAAVAGATLAGAAFADVKVSVGARMRPSAYSYTETYEEEGSKTVLTPDFTGYKSNEDELKFSGTGTNGGVKLVALYTNKAKDYNAGWETVDGTTYSYEISIDEYYGWMQFGHLKLTAGNFNTRGTVSRNSTTLVQDGLSDGDTALYGVGSFSYFAGSAYSTGSTFLADFNDVTGVGGDRQVSALFEYGLEGAGPGNLFLRAAMFGNNFTSVDTDKIAWTKADTYSYTDDVTRIGAGFAASVGYAADTFDVDAVFKQPSQHAWGAGLYADFKGVEGLTVAAGFTYGKRSEYDYIDNDASNDASATVVATAPAFTALAADLRLFYQVSDPLLLGLQAKYSRYEEDDADGETAAEAVLTAQYAYNDMISFQLDGGLYLRDLDDNDGKAAAENYVLVRPAVEFAASKSARVQVAGELTAAINGGDADEVNASATKLKVQVPVIFRVQL